MIVFDNFIKSKKILSEIEKGKDIFFKDTYNDGIKDYNKNLNSNVTPGYWWSGWWDRKPKNMNELLIQYIIKDNNPLEYFNLTNENFFVHTKFEGFEYWTHIHSNDKILHNNVEISPRKNLGWHTNKDDITYEKYGKLIHPLLSIIYWPVPMEVEGGYLEISSLREYDNPNQDDLEICNKCNQEIYTSDVQRIKPKYNRIAIFDPSYYHRVLDVTKGIRYTFVIDIWNKRNLIKEKSNENLS